MGALLGSLFVMFIIGSEADLGANSPNYAFPLPMIFGVEILASALLMAVIVAGSLYERIKRIRWTCHWWNSGT